MLCVSVCLSELPVHADAVLLPRLRSFFLGCEHYNCNFRLRYAGYQAINFDDLLPNMTCTSVVRKTLSSLHALGSSCLRAASRTDHGGGQRQLSVCSSVMERLRKRSCSGEVVVLGIESSCDDTGVALVDQCGLVLGEAIHSQLHVHNRYVSVAIGNL